MYSWKAAAGVSAFGSHTGQITTAPTSSSDEGWCGFKPRYVMVKDVDTSNTWLEFDIFRSGPTTYNSFLKLDELASESAVHSTILVTPTTNGFTTGSHNAVGDSNDANEKYIWAAFA